jgi:hypothetical protein
MRAGAGHPMPHARRIARFLATPAVLACCAAVPSAASAGPLPVPRSEPVPALATTIRGAATPAAEAVNDVVQAARPAQAGLSGPDSGTERHPVADTVAPIAQAAATPVAAAATAGAAPKHLDERARPRTSHIDATSSRVRMGSGRIPRGHGPDGVTRRPSGERAAAAHRAPAAVTDVPAATPAEAATGVPDAQPAGGGPGSAASGGSSGFFFAGGGFALLVASLLVAGPCLRRQLALLPAVCRPAAFLLVLERPG